MYEVASEREEKPCINLRYSTLRLINMQIALVTLYSVVVGNAEFTNGEISLFTANSRVQLPVY